MLFSLGSFNSGGMNKMSKNFQIWMESKLDHRNDRGVNFEVSSIPTIKSLQKYLSILDHLNSDTFYRVSLDRRIPSMLNRLPPRQRNLARLLHHIAFEYPGTYFENDNRGNVKLSIDPDPFRLKSHFSHLLYKGWENDIRSYLMRCKNPCVLSRCMLALLVLPTKATNTAKYIESTYTQTWQEAHQFLKYRCYAIHNRGLMAFKYSCFVLARYFGAIKRLGELEQTIRWMLHEGSLSNVVLEEVGSIILLFSRTEHLKIKKEVAASWVRRLNERVVVVALKKDVNWLQPLADLSCDLAIAYDDKDHAMSQKKKVDQLIVQLGDEIGGPIGLRVIEDLIKANPSGVEGMTRNDYIKKKRGFNRQINESIVPFPVGGVSISGQESVILSHFDQFVTIEEKIYVLTHFPGFLPSSDQINSHLQNRALVAPLVSAIAVSTTQGDRNAGGTETDRDFRKRESLINDFFMPAFLEHALPAITFLLTNEKHFSEFVSSFKASSGWDEQKEKQFDTIIRNLRDERPLETLFVLVSFLEGYIRQTLDVQGVNVDTERAQNAAIIHGNQFETLLKKYAETHCWESIEHELIYCLLLADRAGWNLRNNLYHGQIEDRQIDMARSYIVFYFLLKVYSESFIFAS